MSEARLVLRGFRSIDECLKLNPKRIQSISVRGEPNSREQELIQLAKKAGVPVRREAPSPAGKGGPRSAEALEALMAPYQYISFEDMLADCRERIESGGKPAVLLLDGITDPNNLGALIRTAAFMGMAALVMPKDRAAEVNETVYRIASGGAEHVPVAQVTNLSRALEELKEAGFWVVGFSEHGKQTLASLKHDFPAAIIIGSEEKGMRPLIEKACDHLVRIDGPGTFQTLNASVAGAVAMAWASDLLTKIDG